MPNQELEYRALKLLEQHPNMTQRELSKELGVSLGKAHYVVKELNDTTTRVDNSVRVGEWSSYSHGQFGNRSAAFVRGIAHDGDPDDPVAHMQAVFMTIDKRTVELSAPIKALGSHEATVRLREDVVATLSIEVVSAK